jgi:WD40 repeat protein
MRNEFQPYVGPRPFEREDQSLFFGRDREANELVPFVIAHDLVVIYAQSGAGKTSLTNARLIPDLEEEGFEVLRVERLGRAIPEGFQLNEKANVFVLNTLTIWAKDEADPRRLLQMSLGDYLKERESPRDERGLPSLRVAIFDQFEELFSSYQERWKDRRKFFEQVAAALEEDRFLRVVFVMREEYLGQLDPYAALLPEKLRARFRLECLREKPALAAITGPLRGTGRSFAEGVAEQLVQNLMGNSEYVEPVQLQVVCQNLWDRTKGVTLITSDHLQAFADVDEALMGLYEDALGAATKETGVNEGDLREWFSKHLITPKRTRGDVFRGEEDTAGIPNAAVDILENRRIIRLEERRGGFWYELTHDSWIRPVRRSNENWRKQRDEEEHQRQLEAERQRAREQQQRAERERRVKMRLWGLAALLVAALLVVGILAANNANLARKNFEAEQKAESQRKVAEWQRKVSVAIKLAPRGREIRPHPPDLIESSLLLAVEAVQALRALGEPSIEAEEVIYRGLPLLPPREVARFQQPPAVNSVAFSPDGEHLATGGRDVVTAWDINTKRRVVTMRHSRSILNLFGQRRDVLSVAFSLDGKYLAAGSADGTAQVWETNSWKEVTRANCKGDVYSVAFSPDGEYLAAGSADGTALLWDISTKKRVAIMKHEDEVNVVTFSPDGKHLATGSDDGTARVWEVSSGREVARMVHGAPVYDAAFSPDGKYLAAGSEDDTARLWDVSTRKEVAVMRHEDEVNVVAFSPDGRYLATGSDDGTTRVWEVISGREVARMVYRAPVYSVAFSPDGKYLATGGWDDSARVWDVSTEEEVAIMKHEGGVNVVTFSPDGRYLATGSDDGTARVWEVISGWETRYNVQSYPVYSVTFSPDAKYLAMASRDGTARVRNIPEGREIAMVRHPVEVLRTGAARGLFDSVFAGRTRSPREVADEIAHSVALSPDGRYLATAIGDRTARVWKTATGEQLSKMEHDADVPSVSFSPDRGTWRRLLQMGR